MAEMDKRELIARRVAQEFEDDTVVNLGIGLPTLCVQYIPENIHVMLHSENGFIAFGPTPQPGEEDWSIVNPAGEMVTFIEGTSCFDSILSYGIIRGGHLAATVLGAFEVAENGDLANWMVPGKRVSGTGGAMDLVVGAKRVIVAMEHTSKGGEPRILKRCTLPLTAVGVVKLIVTDMAVIEVTDKGLVLKEVASGVTPEQVQAATEATLTVDPNLKTISV